MRLKSTGDPQFQYGAADLTFLLLGIALVASTIIQVRFGLQPLAPATP
jgi:hypothetical protein